MRPPGESYRYARIAMAAALLAASVLVVGRGLRSANEPAALPPTATPDAPSLPGSTGMFRPVPLREAGLAAPSREAIEYRGEPPTPASSRTLREFYAARAYPGAPPAIPHPVADPAAYGGAACLTCHGDGGWVPSLNAYTPVTPHPALVNCGGCHVAGSKAPVFRRNTFEPAAPALVRRAAAGEPPPLPHGLQMRGDCLACHAGPAAVKEIRVSHPELGRCLECHVAAAASSAPAAGGRRP
jgi:cytochrome c-type protein NapB